jgi:hypothetical protein
MQMGLYSILQSQHPAERYMISTIGIVTHLAKHSSQTESRGKRKQLGEKRVFLFKE